MPIYTVALFGHRYISDLKKLGESLYPIIKELIEKQTYVVFYIGRNGEFDEYASSIIKSAQNTYGVDNSELVLVLPYTVADMKYYADYYDSILIPECVKGAHPKSAISQRNRWMVEQADLVIVNVEQKKGGAFSALQYAHKLHVPVINLASPT